MGNFAIGSRRRGVLLGVGVFLAAMALVAAAFRIAHNERSFEMNRWAVRLHSAATQPLGMVNAWLSDSRSALRAVAVNPTVQIYLSQVAMTPAAPTPESEAQSAFLQSYIASLGSHGAFASTQTGDTGLAVIDAHGHIAAATPGYRPSSGLISALIVQEHEGHAGPLSSRANDGALNAFVLAIRPIQAEGAAAPVGYVIGERRLEQSFWATDGSVLLADHGHESLIALDKPAHLVGASVAAKASLAQSGEFLAAQSPGSLQRMPDLRGQDALHLGSVVKGTNWVLVETVPTASALAGVDAQIRNLLTILLLSLLSIILGILALWRHVAGVQQAAAREAGVKLYRGIAEVLLQAIDQRDPGAAEHSRRVAALSRRIASKMGASQAAADTVELAGAVMNVGKLFVPVTLLTKTGELDEAEASQFAQGSARWLDLLAHTPLDPPLEPVLRDAYRLGRGERVGGEASGQGAHIIVAANRAVALMSPRAYRMAHSPAETLEILSEPRFSIPEPVLAALADILKGHE